MDSIKGQFGFLDYEVEEGKKLFFHMSEVQGNSYNLYPGDTVEFSIVTNHVSLIRNCKLRGGLGGVTKSLLKKMKKKKALKVFKLSNV